MGAAPATKAGAAGRPLENVSLVVPVLNEAESLPKFLRALDSALKPSASSVVTEVLFVDDGSKDGTREALRSYASMPHDFDVRIVERDQARGPANAEIVGCQLASNPWVSKMDVDGQHPLEALRRVTAAVSQDVDVVVASRYTHEGVNDWSPFRGVISRSALLLSQLLIPAARRTTDPVSGFFMVRRQLAEGLDPSIAKYKMLLYVLAKHPNARLREVPFRMGDRRAGRSKIVIRPDVYIPNFLEELLRYGQITRNDAQLLRFEKSSELPRTHARTTRVPAQGYPAGGAFNEGMGARD